jgi:RNA polymerase primary sigma factor
MSTVSNTLTGMEIYLREIARHPLLTRMEERHLSWSIINDGCQQARDALTRSNLRLVVSIARKHLGKGVTMPDLVAEGNVGLIHAVERFDPAMGNRFSTYATWWIKKACRKAVAAASQPVHIPGYMVSRISNWRRSYAELEDELGRSPTAEELAESMDIPACKIPLLMRTIALTGRSVSTGDHSKIDLDGTPSHSRSDDVVEQRDDLRKMELLLSLLEPLPRRILSMRFGLHGQTPLTLKEVGRHVGLTRERIRQLEKAALARLCEGFGSDPEIHAPRSKAV